MNLDSLLGSVVQSGMGRSTGARLKNTMGSGGLLGGLGDLLGGGQGGLGGLLGGGDQGGLGGGNLGGALGGILEQAASAVGGRQNLALGGLGALAGAFLGGGRRSLGGAVGGGLMALLGVMAFQALKGRGGRQAAVPLGLAVPQTAAQKAELEENTGLVLRAMINAAKADGTIDRDEIERLMGKAREGGVDAQAVEYLRSQMGRPMETEALVAAARGKPELAAQMYAASLLAIDVDTAAEKEYLKSLASALGLEPEVTASLRQAVGL